MRCYACVRRVWDADDSLSATSYFSKISLEVSSSTSTQRETRSVRSAATCLVQGSLPQATCDSALSPFATILLKTTALSPSPLASRPIRMSCPRIWPAYQRWEVETDPRRRATHYTRLSMRRGTQRRQRLLCLSRTHPPMAPANLATGFRMDVLCVSYCISSRDSATETPAEHNPLHLAKRLAAMHVTLVSFSLSVVDFVV